MKNISKQTILYFIFAAVTVATFSSSSYAPPSNLTGAQSGYCTDCHGGNALNTTGGSIAATGLPTVYSPGTVYNFTLQLSHASADRAKWGFAMTAVDGAGDLLGTFSTTNPNAAVVGNELQHLNAPSTALSSNYTFTNLTWTAPATASGPVTFYMVGNAANGGGSGGDFIYATIVNAIVLPVTLVNFNGSATRNGVNLVWQTSTELNNHHFEVERAFDGRNFEKIGKVLSKNTVFSLNQYSFQDRNTIGKSAYYRLKQIDNDGRSTLSQVVQIKTNAQNIVSVYPNPTGAPTICAPQ
jgi:hypothetical protein